MNNLTLYHASPGAISKIDNKKYLFCGIFAAKNQRDAESHAEVLHELTIDESKLLTDSALHAIYYNDYSTLSAIVKYELDSATTEDELASVIEAIVDDSSAYDLDIDSDRLCNILCVEDVAHAGWQLQNLRGIIAQKMGYDAVEIFDEHGRTYLVINAAIRVIKND